jgi:sulfate permease, SulP family
MTKALSDYDEERFRVDTAAGLATAAVVIPRLITYAGIADLLMLTSLYLARVPMLIYAFVGGSRSLSCCPRSRRTLPAGYGIGNRPRFSRLAAGGQSL